MNAYRGGPALPGADASARATDDGGPGVTTSRAPRLRTVLGLAQVEAWQLVRNPLLLVGLPAGGIVTWLSIHNSMPLWWDVSWRIGGSQLILGMAVLVVAQLAAGRARRNRLAELYASFPATAATRTLGHLSGLVGAVPASVVLVGAVAAVVQLRGAVGTPSVLVLTGGLLVVIGAGAVGVAIGSRFSHPLAGVLGALALLLSSATSHLATGAAIWLVPWEMVQDQLPELPGPLAGYPPAGAHALELAGLACLAGIVALAVNVGRGRARAGLAAAGIFATAVICLAGILQVRPIPTTDLNRLASEAANPASVQPCTTASQVRYCLYPSFGSLLASLEAPVGAVLAHLPARPAEPLTIRQVVVLDLPDSAFTHGHPEHEVSQWDARMRQAPGSDGTAPSSAIYLQVGAWPAASGPLADAHFDLAMAAAQWAVGLQGTDGVISSTQEFLPCVPAGQAREAVAIWLAIIATHPSASELRSGLGGNASTQGEIVDGSFVRTWNYPGLIGYVMAPGGSPQNTAAGYLLANEMTNLPAQQVSRVLADGWSRWLNWHTTDAQLAAALGVRMPSVSSRVTLPSGKTVTITPTAGNAPQAQLCTT